LEEIERMEFTINAYSKYETNQIDIIQFLSQIDPRYQGKKIVIYLLLILTNLIIFVLFYFYFNNRVYIFNIYA